MTVNAESQEAPFLSKLRYFGTDQEVLPGDRIEFTSLILRRKRLGTVVCIPEKTALELNAEKKQPENWLIKLDNGIYTGWIYHPEELQPPSRLRLLERGAEYEPMTGAELERLDSEIASQTSPLESLLGCGVVIAIAVIIILTIRYALQLFN